jgi:hypothetical protein
MSGFASALSPAFPLSLFLAAPLTQKNPALSHRAFRSVLERKVAEETISDVDALGHWPGKVVTKISDAGPFWEAEVGDQDYFQRYLGGCAPPFPRRDVDPADRETAA